MSVKTKIDYVVNSDTWVVHKRVDGDVFCNKHILIHIAPLKTLHQAMAVSNYTRECKSCFEKGLA